LDYLDELKVAADERREVLITYAGSHFQLMLAMAGSDTRFILKGGPDGATWFIKKPNARPVGNPLSAVRNFMAMHGLVCCKGAC
jgi:hypothetical protein